MDTLNELVSDGAITQSAVSTNEYNVEVLDKISQGIDSLNTLGTVFLVLFGITVSFFLVRFIWRLCFKPLLRDYIKFNI